MAHGAEHAVKNVIGAVIFPAAFDAEHVPRFGDHADNALVPGLAGTNGADVPFCQILADTATVYIFLRVRDCVGKALRLVIRKPQHIKRQALCALSADSGQRRKMINKILQRCGKERHILLLTDSWYACGWPARRQLDRPCRKLRCPRRAPGLRPLRPAVQSPRRYLRPPQAHSRGPGSRYNRGRC